MKSSIGIAVRVWYLPVPREPSSSETRAIVVSSGASSTLTKSYWPRVAHCAVTVAPSCSTSLLTSRIRLGLFFSVATPSEVNVVSRMYVGIWPPGSGASVFLSALAAVCKQAERDCAHRRRDRDGVAGRRELLACGNGRGEVGGVGRRAGQDPRSRVAPAGQRRHRARAQHEVARAQDAAEEDRAGAACDAAEPQRSRALGDKAEAEAECDPAGGEEAGDVARLHGAASYVAWQAGGVRDDAELRPWFEHAVGLLPGVDIFDVHLHIGENDPDGFKATAPQIVHALELAGARGVVFPFHEPDGYSEANDRVIADAAASGGRLAAFCRVDPNAGDAVHEAERALDAGARGIKLHPRSEGFSLDEPEVRRVFEIAHERKLPVLIHAGRGIPALGRHAVALAEELPDARVILAHCGISDLSWI